MKRMNLEPKKILSVIRDDEKVRVSDVASRLYISKQKARRYLRALEIMNLIKEEKYHYVGNADICVYSKI